MTTEPLPLPGMDTPTPRGENPTEPASAMGGRGRSVSRSAVWKSVVGATGGFGCERATFYRETVRTPDGWRLDDGAEEPVLFGIAIDRVHGRLMAARRERGDEPVTEDMLWADIGAAVRHGIEVARGRTTRAPMTDDDWRILTERVGLAAEKLVGLWPNRVKMKAGQRVTDLTPPEDIEWVRMPEPDGTPPGPPIAWLDQPAGVSIEAQRKMAAPGVVGGRGVSGQPDYVFVRDGIIIGWVDIKAQGKAGSYPSRWLGGEAVTYDYLCWHDNGGVAPEWHGFMEYRRVQKPYWALIIAPAVPESITLATAYFDRWGTALDGDDPTGLAFSPRSCHDCMFRVPMPELGFAGCPIGPAAVAVAPVTEAPVDD